MDCDLEILENGGSALTINNNFKLAGIRLWKTGSPIKKERKDNIPNPVHLDFDVHHGYEGLPPEIEDLGIPLMSKRLCDILLNAGVDNLELFPAKLKNNQTGQEFDYYVYNILGLVAAMDLKKSTYETYRDKKPSGDTTIHELVIDEDEIHDALFFRLAEDLSTIVVHESIKNAIESAGLNTILFIKPEDYSQI